MARYNEKISTIDIKISRTLLESEMSDKPQRRAALIDNELYKIIADITSLQEKRFSREGLLREPTTMTYPDEEKEAFYEQLCLVISRVPSRDKLIMLGYFNARVGLGSNYRTLCPALGKF